MPLESESPHGAEILEHSTISLILSLFMNCWSVVPSSDTILWYRILRQQMYIHYEGLAPTFQTLIDWLIEDIKDLTCPVARWPLPVPSFWQQVCYNTKTWCFEGQMFLISICSSFENLHCLCNNVKLFHSATSHSGVFFQFIRSKGIQEIILGRTCGMTFSKNQYMLVTSVLYRKYYTSLSQQKAVMDWQIECVQQLCLKLTAPGVPWYHIPPTSTETVPNWSATFPIKMLNSKQTESAASLEL